MTNRHAFSLVLASLTGLILLLAVCANPAAGTPSANTLTIQPAGTTMPAGVMSFSPGTIKLNGSYYSFDSMANTASSSPATIPATSAYIVYSVNAASAGTYSLRFFYAFGGTATNLRDAWLVINGSKVTVDTDQIIEFAYTGGTTTYGYTPSIAVPLIAGDNEIRLVAVNTIGYTRLVPAGTGIMRGLANISALEITGSPALTAGTGATSLYSLTASVKAGSGAITVDPVQDFYLPGTTVTLTATPDAGYVFDTWEGDISGTSGTYIATMTGNLAVTARFIPDSASQPPELAGFGCVQDDTGTAYTLTGGYGGATVVVSTLADLQTCLTSASPYTVIVNGLITSGSGTISTSITVASNKTIYGAIPDGGTYTQGHLKNIELKLSGENYIVRNLVFSEVVGYDGHGGTGNDNITIGGGRHIWIDHCEFYSQLEPADCPDFAGPNDGPADGVVDEYDYKDYYDGQIDASDVARWITISNNYFHDHWKSLLWGDSDTDTADAGMRITLHHNYFRNVHSRQPMVRFGRAHVFNNYYDGILDSGSPVSDGVNSRRTADLYIQGNFFLNLKNTVFTSDGSGTYNLADNLAYTCTNPLPASTSGWTPGYNWTADAAAVIQAGDPTSWAGVGIMTSLP